MIFHIIALSPGPVTGVTLVTRDGALKLLGLRGTQKVLKGVSIDFKGLLIGSNGAPQRNHTRH